MWRHRPARKGMLGAVSFPTLPFKRSFSCTLGTLPVVEFPAGVLFASIARFVSAKGFVRFTTSVSRPEIELQTDIELTLEEVATIAGLCEEYDLARARTYPAA